MPDFRDKDEIRVGTQEREAAVDVLGKHLAEGRLSLDEYDERMSAAIEAKTRGDLRDLFVDLPAPYPEFMTPPAAPTPPVRYQPAPPPAVHSDRYRVVAGVLQIVLPFGTGRFYTGHFNIALAQLLTVFLFGIGVIWSIIDGILILIAGGTDANDKPLRI